MTKKEFSLILFSHSIDWLQKAEKSLKSIKVKTFWRVSSVFQKLRGRLRSKILNFPDIEFTVCTTYYVGKKKIFFWLRLYIIEIVNKC